MNMFLDEMEDNTFNYDVSFIGVRKSVRGLRQDRHQKMIGHFVITADGISSKKRVYLQDPEFSRTQHWTEFPTNARVFTSYEEASRIAKRFIYNNPRVVKVLSQNKMEILESE